MKKIDIGRIIRSICRNFHPAAYLFIPVIRIKDSFDGKRMHKAMARYIAIHCKETQMNDRAYMRRLKRDMWYSFILYNCAFDEYFMFHFPRLSHQGRLEFVTEGEKVYLCQHLSAKHVQDVFKNKWNTYQLFKEFYKRDAIKVDRDTPFEEFSAFAAAHPKFIVKPYDESCGHGIFLYNPAADSRSLPELFFEFQRQPVVLEELITQSEELSRLHPASVNTIRCTTLLKDSRVHILFTFLRIGRGNSLVDNGGAGGFVASIDPETGIVFTPGVTETGLSALVHPDTGAQIIGMKIPQWDALKETAEKLAKTYPEQPYVGWDLALTEQGWIMVEGNHAGQFIGPQFTTQRGIRSLLSQYFDL